MHENVHRGLEGDAFLGGHGEEPEAHPHVEPFTDPGAMQGRLAFLVRPGRIAAGLFLARLGAAT